jgi:hypothetical protein
MDVFDVLAADLQIARASPVFIQITEPTVKVCGLTQPHKATMECPPIVAVTSRYPGFVASASDVCSRSGTGCAAGAGASDWPVATNVW